MKIIVLLITTILLTGCTSSRISRNLSAGVVGCPAKQIKITNESASIDGFHEFNAECEGHKYLCSYHSTAGINCSELKQPQFEEQHYDNKQ